MNEYPNGNFQWQWDGKVVLKEKKNHKGGNERGRIRRIYCYCI